MSLSFFMFRRKWSSFSLPKMNEFCDSDPWNKSFGSVHFITVNLQWQNCVNLTD